MQPGLKRPLDLAMEITRSNPFKISLSEGADPRVVEAAVKAVNLGIAKIILIGNSAKIKERLEQYSCSKPDHIELHDPITSPLKEEFSKSFYNLRKHKGITRSEAEKQVASNLVYAALLVKHGYADGTLSGSVETTSNVVKTALWVIGKATNVNTVSSCFLIFPKTYEPMIYADCGLVIEPNESELVDITMAASQTCRGPFKVRPESCITIFLDQRERKP